MALLQEMGFPPAAARAALQRFGGGLDLAVAHLLAGGSGGGGGGQAPGAQQRAAAQTEQAAGGAAATSPVAPGAGDAAMDSLRGHQGGAADEAMAEAAAPSQAGPSTAAAAGAAAGAAAAGASEAQEQQPAGEAHEAEMADAQDVAPGLVVRLCTSARQPGGRQHSAAALLRAPCGASGCPGPASDLLHALHPHPGASASLPTLPDRFKRQRSRHGDYGQLDVDNLVEPTGTLPGPVLAGGLHASHSADDTERPFLVFVCRPPFPAHCADRQRRVGGG